MMPAYISLAIAAVLALLMLRLNRVHEYRMACIESISQLNQLDIMALKDASPTEDNYIKMKQAFNGRWVDYYSISYDRMLWQFWRPVDTFYDEFYDWLPPDPEA
jgi:hypothetical protein